MVKVMTKEKATEITKLNEDIDKIKRVIVSLEKELKELEKNRRRKEMLLEKLEELEKQNQE